MLKNNSSGIGVTSDRTLLFRMYGHTILVGNKNRDNFFLIKAATPPPFQFDSDSCKV